MTYLEKAIEDAVRGGYETRENNDYVNFGGVGSFSIFLDSKFWQCLGKSREWREHENRSMKEKILGVYGPEWRVHQHQLLDALAEGRTIESFFESLENEE